MNLFRFCFVTETVVCLFMAIQPAFAVAPERGLVSSPAAILPGVDTSLNSLQTKALVPSGNKARDAAINGDRSTQQASIRKGEDNNKQKGAGTEMAQFLGQMPDPSSMPIAPNVSSPPDSSNGVLVPNPTITIKSNGTANPDIINPLAPPVPVLPRAIAPPVGDISVSNINPGYTAIDLGPSGQTIVPRLVLREAPVKEVLMVLARYAGVNIIFTGGDAGGTGTPPAPGGNTGGAQTTISLDLQNEPVQQVFNSVLMVSGLKANKRGSTIFIGEKLPDTVRNVVSRTLRLNQAKAENVATILASQGAEFQLLIQPEALVEAGTTKVSEKGDIQIEAPKTGPKPPPALTSIKVKKDEDSAAAYVLKDLLVSIDDRLNSITLIGEPRQVELATSIVLQMDARRRQVSINVKVVDVNLTSTQIQNVDFNFGGGPGSYGYNQLNNSTTPNSTVLNVGSGIGALGLIPNVNSFNATIEYAIRNGNAKVLTDPTLVVQEGQVANVAIVRNVLSGSTTTFQTAGAGTSAVTVPITQPTFEFVGLTLGINVDSIDDNGFVSLSVNPTISAPYDTVLFDSGGGTGSVPNRFTLITKREVQSGLIRLRDGQTLILSGIITEQDRSTVTKVPILGDIPFLGILFRSQEDSTDRSEVVVMLTPKIIHDDTGSQFGYNYTPSKATADYLQQQSFPVQPQP